MAVMVENLGEHGVVKTGQDVGTLGLDHIKPKPMNSLLLRILIRHRNPNIVHLVLFLLPKSALSSLPT